MAFLKDATWRVSRRAFALGLTGAALGRLCRAAGDEWPDPTAGSIEAAATLNLERRYRADAHILVLGLPLLRRTDVGGGSVVWREFVGGPATQLLEFTGFSDPQRAAGLNRMGFIREIARPNAAGSVYFGLMTSSPEESAEEARKALHTVAKEQVYSAIKGRITRGVSETAAAHFTVAGSGVASTELVERAKLALQTAEKVTNPNAVSACGSFLQTLAGMLTRPDRTEGQYNYSGRGYVLRLSRAPDAKATEYFRERRLLADAAQAIRISGRLRRQAGGKETEFRVWIAEGAERPLPLRIEYQPKSYLRLVFEATPGSSS